MNFPTKPTFEEFIPTCTPLAQIKELEDEFDARIQTISTALMGFQSQEDPKENLANFLQADQDFLGIVLALANLSQEKFYRLLAAQRFAKGDYGTEWDKDRIFRELTKDRNFAVTLAELFIQGRESPLLKAHISRFYLNQLALPTDWQRIIQDPVLIQSVVRKKLAGEYSVKKGKAIEELINQHLNTLTQEYGIPYQKGQVRLVGKEVDHVLPSRDEPWIMIMSSYMETTASGQTARANEQRDMYLSVENDNLRYGYRRILINFIDGAGWLARRSDLRKIHGSCHYIVNLKTLHLLSDIIISNIPSSYRKKG